MLPKVIFLLLTSKIGFARVAVLEARTNELLGGAKCDGLSEHAVIKTDGANNELKSIEQELTGIEENREDYKYIQLVTLAHVLVLQGKYTDAINLLEPLSTSVPENQDPSLPLNYLSTVRTKKSAILGTAYEAVNQLDDAIKEYQSVREKDEAGTMKFDSPENLLWAERLYYRFAKLATTARFSDSEVTISAFRGYRSISNQLMKKGERITDSSADNRYRIEMLNQYLVYISSVFRNDPANKQLAQETQQVSETYERYLFEKSTFPTSSVSGQPIEEYIDVLVANWGLVTTLSGFHQVVTSKEEISHTKRVLLSVRKAATLTFHSCSIMRHHVMLLSALGEYKEAIAAFDTYMSYQEKYRLRLESGSELEHETGDSNYLVVKVISKVILIYTYIFKDATTAQSCVAKLETWLNSGDMAEVDNDGKTEVAAVAYAAIGRAYFFYAGKLTSESDYESALDTAKANFERSIDLRPKDAEVYLDYALLSSRCGDISLALANVKEGLMYNHMHIPLWNLMALLLSAQEEYSTALQVVNNALYDVENNNVIPILDEEKQAYIQLKMTQVALVEASEGPFEALDYLPEVFALFNSLYQPHTESEAMIKEDREENSNERNGNIDENVNGEAVNIEGDNIFNLPNGNTANGTHTKKEKRAERRSERKAERRQRKGDPSDEKQELPNSELNGSAPQRSSAIQKHRRSFSRQVSAVHRTLSERRKKNTAGTTNGGKIKRSDPEIAFLKDLWLWIAGMYRRADLLHDADQAIVEAEDLSGPTPNSHAETGILISKERPVRAMEEFESALDEEPENLKAILGLSQLVLAHSSSCDNKALQSATKATTYSLFISEKDEAAAHARVLSLLETFVQTSPARYVSEAWWILSHFYDMTNREEEMQKALWKSVGLEETRGIRDFGCIR